MGFCLFNNIAIAARYAQHRRHRSRADRRLGRASRQRHAGYFLFRRFRIFLQYPSASAGIPEPARTNETGEGPGQGTTLNCPYPAGSGRKEILGAFQEKLLAAAESFKPGLVLVSAGFDSRIGDPLGNFLLTDADFSDLTNVMREIADKHAGGRLVSLLEGGYSLEGLAAGVRAHVAALA